MCFLRMLDYGPNYGPNGLDYSCLLASWQADPMSAGTPSSPVLHCRSQKKSPLKGGLWSSIMSASQQVLETLNPKP